MARADALWTPLGDRAIRFSRPAGASPRAIVQAARAWPGVIDVVVAAHDVAVYFDGPPVINDAQLRALASAPDAPEPGRELTLVAIYDGPDLDAIAAAARLSISDVISLYAGATYVVDTLGFAPGFAYLTGLDARLHLPRRATPRARVPGGSLAIAGGYTAVYPFDSPGGWHLLGRVAISAGSPLFGSAGALLQLGDRVRFVRSAP